MIASVKLELWYLESAEMVRLQEEEPLRGLGAVVCLLVYLRRQHKAVGCRQSMQKVAREYRCDTDWLWHVVCDFGLFTVAADGSFYSPYLRQTLGMTANPGDHPSRTHKRKRAPYSEDSKDSNDSENRKITPASCVCLQGTQETADDAAPSPPPTYLGYDRWVDGCRYGFRGEPVPDNAPEQVSQDTRWSWTKGRWIPRAQWHVIREKKAYERITQQRWQTMGNGRS